MRSISALYHLVLANYLERSRRSAFFIVLGSTIFAGYLFTPARNAGYSTLAFGQDNAALWYRGAYNSAWVATQVALWAVIWLALIGFFLIRSGVEYDSQTGVGQIIATTPLRKLTYILGKMLSNLAVLASVCVVLLFATAAMQLLRGESTQLDVWQLVSPFIFFLLPTIALISAIAVLFECVSWLRGTVGSVVYMAFYCTITSVVFASGQAISPFVDVFGVTHSIQQINAAMHAAAPAFKETLNIGIAPTSVPPHTFVWPGTLWTPDVVDGRLFWLAISFALVIVASILFSRFDPAKEGSARSAKRVKQETEVQEVREERTMPANMRLTPLPAGRGKGLVALGAVLVGELRLLAKEVPWWWYPGALLWAVLCLTLPLDVARGYLFPIALLWPLPIWSSLGSREKQYQTQQLVFPAPRVLQRQLILLYGAAVCVTLLAASGMFVRYIVSGDATHLLALVPAVLFIPALALASGVWTSSRRVFELVYVSLWYVGAINQTAVLDFMGVTSASLAMSIPYIFGGIAVILLLCSFVGRKLQMQRYAS